MKRSERGKYGVGRCGPAGPHGVQKRWLLRLSMIPLAITIGTVAATGEEKKIEQVIDRAIKATFLVSTPKGTGSGFMIANPFADSMREQMRKTKERFRWGFFATNYLVTSYHVLDGFCRPDQIAIARSDGIRLKLSGFTYGSRSEDLVILAVSRAETSSENTQLWSEVLTGSLFSDALAKYLHTLSLGDSDMGLGLDPEQYARVMGKTIVRAGQKVYVIGFPRAAELSALGGRESGLSPTVSDGIVAGRKMVHGIDVIQITAPISPGSSGGPVITEDGQVIGIASYSLVDSQNINFAIPSSHVESNLANSTQALQDAPWCPK
ncbi:MAG: serine protease [Nitrospirae bacterium]|nr:serine protease [Nitrospirota bacterium]